MPTPASVHTAGGMLMVMAMLALPFAIAGQSTATITGRALDLMLEVPVVSAEVHLINEAERRVESSVTTDAEGRFTFRAIEGGEYRLRAGSLGYLEVITPVLEVEAADSAYVMEVIVWMSPDAVPIAPLEVVASSRPDVMRAGVAAFLDRADRSAVGIFIMRDDIPPSTRRTSDLLFSAGVNEVSGRGLTMTRGGCVPAVWIDGVRVSRDRQAIPSDAYEAVNVLIPDQIEGIEVYASPLLVPAVLGGRGAICGVISLWTRI